MHVCWKLVWPASLWEITMLILQLQVFSWDSWLKQPVFVSLALQLLIPKRTEGRRWIEKLHKSFSVQLCEETRVRSVLTLSSFAAHLFWPFWDKKDFFCGKLMATEVGKRKLFKRQWTVAISDRSQSGSLSLFLLTVLALSVISIKAGWINLNCCQGRLLQNNVKSPWGQT